MEVSNRRMDKSREKIQDYFEKILLQEDKKGNEINSTSINEEILELIIEKEFDFFITLIITFYNEIGIKDEKYFSIENLIVILNNIISNESIDVKFFNLILENH
jgi:hypothetical protein